MDKLISQIAKDLNIVPCSLEPQSCFNARVLYSALGAWAISFIQDSYVDSVSDSSKRHIFLGIQRLQERYCSIYPESSSYFQSNEDICASFISRIYCDAGIFNSTSRSRCKLNNYIDRIYITGSKSLSLVPSFGMDAMFGLGFIQKEEANRSINNAFLQDLTAKNVLPILVQQLRFEQDAASFWGLEYFDPLCKKSLSSSWGKKRTVDMTLARKNHIYYIVKQDKLAYLPDVYYKQQDILAYEFRRLEYGLRALYDNNSIANIIQHDEKYFSLKLQSFLPRNEYILLTLLGWPQDSFANQLEFLFPIETKACIHSILEHLSINVEE